MLLKVSDLCAVSENLSTNSFSIQSLGIFFKAARYSKPLRRT